MLRALLASLAIVLASATVPAKAPKPKPVSYRSDGASPNSSLMSYDAEAEQQLLMLANQARARAGLPPLQRDEGLTQAARQHAFALASQPQLSHQFSGEPSLALRLAAGTTLHLSRAGENVALGTTVERVHEDLMLSPRHRDNLLNPGYNVAGFGVIRCRDRLYVTQDFGEGAVTYSSQKSDEMVAASVNRMRVSAGLAQLQRVEDRATQTAACSLAEANTLNIPLPREITSRYVLRYTTMQPEAVPESASKIIEVRSIQKFSEGTCYSRTITYPNGVYWVVLTFF